MMDLPTSAVILRTLSYAMGTKDLNDLSLVMFLTSAQSMSALWPPSKSLP